MLLRDSRLRDERDGVRVNVYAAERRNASKTFRVLVGSRQQKAETRQPLALQLQGGLGEPAESTGRGPGHCFRRAGHQDGLEVVHVEDCDTSVRSDLLPIRGAPEVLDDREIVAAATQKTAHVGGKPGETVVERGNPTEETAHVPGHPRRRGFGVMRQVEDSNLPDQASRGSSEPGPRRPAPGRQSHPPHSGFPGTPTTRPTEWLRRPKPDTAPPAQGTGREVWSLSPILTLRSGAALPDRPPW